MLTKLVRYSLYITVIVFLLTTHSVFAKDLNLLNGKLFTNKQQRIMLDNARKRNPQIISSSTATQTKDQQAQDDITLKGIVARKNGKNVAWINEHNTMNKNLQEFGVSVVSKRFDRNRITISTGSKTLLLRPGESINGKTGNIDNVFTIKKKP